MKVSDEFKNTIKEHLDQRAQTDGLFAVSYAKENKNLDDCITYILNTVKSSGRNGFTDPEIFGMAVHYYDEDDVKVGKLPSNMKMVVNHHVQLSEEEKQKAHEAALKRAQDEAYEKLTKRVKPKKEDDSVKQTSLFD